MRAMMGLTGMFFTFGAPLLLPLAVSTTLALPTTVPVNTGVAVFAPLSAAMPASSAR